MGQTGLEPVNPEGRAFTVLRLCRFATDPNLGKQKMGEWTSVFIIGITYFTSDSDTTFPQLTFFCAQRKTRTFTSRRTPVSKTDASTNSAIQA